MRYLKQERYELFLDGVQKKQDATILGSRSKLCEQMAKIINTMEEIDRIRENPNWKAKTLPKMREAYVLLRDAKDSNTVLSMAHSIANHLSGWFQMRAGLIDVQLTHVNDSYKNDPKAIRIVSIDLEFGFKTDHANCSKCMVPMKHTDPNQKYSDMICESCAVVNAAH